MMIETAVCNANNATDLERRHQAIKVILTHAHRPEVECRISITRWQQMTGRPAVQAVMGKTFDELMRKRSREQDTEAVHDQFGERAINSIP